MKQTMHVKAPDNWVNDPNGFIYYKGKYHLFYQYNPNAPVWGTMHWGHAVSKDLIHWEHQGIALYPSCPGDQDGCFSGSAVEYEGKLHLFYTGIRYLDPEVKDRIESVQLHIVSEDGVHFDNENGKKIIVPPAMKKAYKTCHTIWFFRLNLCIMKQYSMSFYGILPGRRYCDERQELCDGK